MRQRYILTLETLDVAHHFGLGVVLVEYLVGQEGGGADELTIKMDRVFAYLIVEVAFLAEGRGKDVAEDTKVFGEGCLVDTD